MSFIALVLALLIEQVRPLPDGNLLHQGVAQWHQWVRHFIHPDDQRSAWTAWSMAVVLPTVLVLLIHWLLLYVLGWFLAIVWACLVLYACLGFRQFSHHFSSIRDAISMGQYDEAAQALAQWRGVDRVTSEPTELTRQLIEHASLESHRHVFGVVFWFSMLAALGLGPTGAVFYRLNEFVARAWSNRSDDFPVSGQVDAQVSAQAWHMVDWLCVRVTALMFAIAGNFEDAVDAWRTQASRQSLSNEEVLICATSGAIGVQLGAAFQSEATNSMASDTTTASMKPQSHHLRSLVGLVWRTVVAWVALLGLMTLARLLG